MSYFKELRTILKGDSDETCICCPASHSDPKLPCDKRDPMCSSRGTRYFTCVKGSPAGRTILRRFSSSLPVHSSPSLSASPPPAPEALPPTLMRLCTPSPGRAARRRITQLDDDRHSLVSVLSQSLGRGWRGSGEGGSGVD